LVKGGELQISLNGQLIAKSGNFLKNVICTYFKNDTGKLSYLRVQNFDTNDLQEHLEVAPKWIGLTSTKQLYTSHES
jgi:hypothetical protein